MTTSEEFVALMDELANRYLGGGESPYEVSNDVRRLWDMHDYEPAQWADSARYFIQELADEPRGPFSIELAEETFRAMAQAWTMLDERHDAAIQTGFFKSWHDKADGMIAEVALGREPRA